jgi:hypothetical protein
LSGDDGNLNDGMLGFESEVDEVGVSGKAEEESERLERLA